MHYVHNLDTEKEIYSQMEGFAVATNLMHPKPEDFHYKYSECEPWQKDMLLGMAIAADQIDLLWENKEIMEGSNEPELIKKLREEYQENALCEAQDWIVRCMCEHLISFGDTNACEKE